MFSFPTNLGARGTSNALLQPFRLDATSVVLNSRHEETIDPGFIYMPRASLILENEVRFAFFRVLASAAGSRVSQACPRSGATSTLPLSTARCNGVSGNSSTHTGFAQGSSAEVTGWQKTHRNCSDGFSASS